jgi:hypothetical protein
MITLVTQNGMTANQPGISSSTTHQLGTSVWRLNVSRYYPNLRNSFGGLGVSKRCDADGMEFSSSEAARQYALEHGYLQPYFTSPALRARRLAMRDMIQAEKKARLTRLPKPPREIILD